MRRTHALAALAFTLGCSARGSDLYVVTPTPDAGRSEVATGGDDASVSVDVPSFDIPRFDVPSVDVPQGTDRGPTAVDIPLPTDRGFPVDRGPATVDAGPPSTVRAGGPCLTDGDCDFALTQVCLRNLSGAGFCTNSDLCMNSSVSAEQAECGGRGSTCLTFVPFDVPDGTGLCTRSCTVNALTEAMGACRAGMLCTGFWYRDGVGDGDSPGCFPFCTTDADCVGAVAGDASVMRCNVRTGFCASTPANLALRADGEPCNPQEVTSTMTPQCRGLCFSVSSTAPTRGLCGSYVNLRATTYCLDDPSQQPIVPIDSVTRAPTDEIGICLRRGCTRNADCTAPTLCLYPEDATGMVYRDLPATCGYPTTSQPGGIG